MDGRTRVSDPIIAGRVIRIRRRAVRDDILANLTLLHPYVPVYIEPCGFENAEVRQAIVQC